ncbi:MAG: riboflavin synthase [Desulfuromonadales bacterium]|nr:MAG: riboflavin synthase [Desulfuromonadales bacterium]
MFTGLIEDVGFFRRIERTGAAARLTATTSLSLESVAIGDSVAVNGACLTVVAKKGGDLTFDVSPETLERTTLGTIGSGAPLNLERALRMGDRLGGHIVTGHVDCIATVVERREVSGNILFTFRIPRESARYFVAKGSVAIDGISLTVNTVSDDSFTVNIIPLTAVKTTLLVRRAGDRVNIETDILGKYVERLLGFTHKGANDGGVTLELLAKNGFL